MLSLTTANGAVLLNSVPMSIKVILIELHRRAKGCTIIFIILRIIRSSSSKGKEGHSKQKKSYVHMTGNLIQIKISLDNF